ncbi:MAG: FAD-dependent oxidoreductase, partial [Rhizobiaceae bacterium]
MSPRPAIIIVGAGIVGASIAFHLARAGAPVTLIARPGSGAATAGSFGWINASYGNPAHYFPLRHRAMAQWHRLSETVPDLPWRMTGGLCFDDTDDALRAFARQHAEWGYGIREVGRDEIARIEPALARPPAIAMHV